MGEGLLQPMHLLLILLICLLIFGPKKLPDLGKGLGEGIRSFKDAMRGDKPAPQSQPELKSADPSTPENSDKIDKA
jgi:sec-independent protein translocase protein TatA